MDGDNGSLGIALSIFGPLAPSALPRPTGTTLDSIPFHSTPFPPLDYPGNSRGTVPSFLCQGKPPSNTALPKLRCRASPLSPLSWRMTLHSLGCICIVFPLPRTPPRQIHLTNICIVLYIIYRHFHEIYFSMKLFRELG